MAREDYPFDSDGRYVTAWAEEGERKAGRGPASDSDFDSWRSSHGGSVRKNASPVKKVSTSSAKKKVASSSKNSKGTTKSKTVAKSGGGSYTIKKGDTLSAIARKNNTTVAKLKAANGMTSDMIRDGKSLKIPK